ncbi:MAG: CsgG/HfaB family protein [Desulfuromonadales bacterium]|nr:CsgG/HfaB family protein [Desulfuromonadales bacterium]
MKRQICTPRKNLAIVAFLALLIPGCLQSNPEVDHSYTSRRLESMPAQAGPKKTVTIYQFESSVPEISANAATDMFTTALIKSHSFLVLERQRLEESVYREKQLNQQGMTTGDAAQHQLTGAEYIFVGTVSEANATASRTGVAGSYRGLGVETSGEKGEIGLDVRILDARTGAVIDAVNTRKKVSEGGVSVSGIGSFMRSVTGKKIKGADAGVAHDQKEGIDKALRACIEEAIHEIAARYGRL